MIFSVIVPFLNEEPYIEQCARALIEQDFDKGRYEIIFVDNGSTDRSADVIRKFPQITLLRENKKGPYAARNKALKIAEGRIIAFTDADRVASRDWLKKIEEGMKDTDVAIALGRCEFNHAGSVLLKLFENYENAKAEYTFNKCPKEYYYGYTGNMALKAELFKNHGPFLEVPILGDLEFVQRCLSGDSKIKVIYLKDMKIAHLEITNYRVWLNKIYRYGMHSRHEAMPSYRPLTFGYKLGIFKQCILDNNYGFIKGMLFFVLLITGDMHYKAGRLTGWIKDHLSQ